MRTSGKLASSPLFGGSLSETPDLLVYVQSGTLSSALHMLERVRSSTAPVLCLSFRIGCDTRVSDDCLYYMERKCIYQQQGNGPCSSGISRNRCTPTAFDCAFTLIVPSISVFDCSLAEIVASGSAYKERSMHRLPAMLHTLEPDPHAAP
ncbi:hypothetical protein K437DRAFT_182069 [Tilletiaria anomala UBC 951]|uniref:Uncharacterized protein n=1 Tax=Tilletiaria anomala (strain ATCC 24038 / CBS 436.72 / UBC 951) TaxID=1037660 RepID=A0A066VHE6_TILAU|nr:uncharacterized protein K437DRAFT_182069 [Tilletiaria anomala UBC 951]KDN40881.1 hypothetical protein K437DRAFT_182069 [Tilletiaria anomala UBC 951]